MSRQINLTGTVVLALILVACSPPVKEPERTGFISDYSNLKLEEDEAIELTEDEAYVYVNDKMKNYRKFLIDDIVLLYQQDPENNKFKPEELDELLEHARSELTEALTEGDTYTITTEPGEGVARIRIALTDIKATIGALNITTYTKITGAGLGGAAVEGEVIDSITGEQLAAAMRWGGGGRFGRAGYTKTGDAKIILTRWAKGWRKKLDKLNDITD
jgi:hypothetical protein